ncbi:MAG: PilZ domain-containing protein [Vicinamibacteria bacterium]|nr:PilZ domain-containing protein [Vicinamibacteria bacterium]
MMTRSERRRFSRVRLDGRLSGKVTVVLDFRIVALSETGATIQLPFPLKAGLPCDLVLHLAHVSLDLKGHVTNLTPPLDADGPYQVGIHFDRPQSIDRALLESFLERERRKRR